MNDFSTYVFELGFNISVNRVELGDFLPEKDEVVITVDFWLLLVSCSAPLVSRTFGCYVSARFVGASPPYATA